ncbi:dockerin type I domain-containing protein, partial [Rubripirellula amarantea]|nr:dockerin type I domain-containing protein [Rubripirellula amarantea]
DVTISGVTLSGGDAGSGNGGAIRSATDGLLLLKYVELAGNSAADGGALYVSDGSLSLAATTFADNTATGDGGAVAVSGLTSAMTVVNTTIANNSAGGNGGGIHLPSGSLTIASSTISGNNATGDGGGLWTDPTQPATLSISNSIVAANTAASGADFVAPSNPNTNLTVLSSLIGSNDATSLTESTVSGGVPEADSDNNFVGGIEGAIIIPFLSPLGDNGGSLRTIAPLSNSLALDSGNAALLPQDSFDLNADNVLTEILPIDARGGQRVTTGLDMGAVELPPAPAVNWDAISDIVFGIQLDATQLNATSPIAGTFNYTPAAGTILNAGAGQTLTAVFVPSNPLAFRSVTITNTINVDKADPVITWDDPDPINFGTELSDTQLDATSPVPGTFVYTPASGTVLPVGNQALNVTFTPDDSDNYNEAVASATLVVNSSDVNVTWTDPEDIVFGTALSATQLNAAADVAGTFTYTPALGTVLDAGDAQTLTVVFTPEDTTLAEVTVSVAINVAKADPVLTWNPPGSITVGTELSSSQLNATANVAGTFAYTPDLGTTLDVGDDQVLSVVFTPTDSVNYNEVSTSVTIDVVDSAVFDFGDAPSPYPVLLADNGARHTIGSLRLGPSVDSETEGSVSDQADGDGADEDGVVLISSILRDDNDTFESSFYVEASEAGQLDAWLDLNGDGDWDDAGEKIADSVALTAGGNVITMIVPTTAVAGETFARFRVSSTGGLTPTGEAADGEVEDYVIAILEGDGSNDVVVDIPTGNIVITADAGGLVIEGLGGQRLFAGPTSGFASVTVNANDEDNQFQILGKEPIGALTIIGGDGIDSVELAAAELDLTADSISLNSIASIAMTADTVQTVTIDVNAVASMTDADQIVRVSGGSLDRLVFTDGDDWTVGDPLVDNGIFTIVITHDTTGETVHTNMGSQWQNPLRPSDVNRNGSVTAGDALLIINELGRRTYSDRDTQQLEDAATTETFPGFYYDQNGDGNATALDALRVINEVARINNSGGGSEEGEWSLLVDELLRQVSETSPTSDDSPVESLEVSKIASFESTESESSPSSRDTSSTAERAASTNDASLMELLSSEL